ncbi:MAG TPA: hypothetical protein VNE82_11275 [Candidatus Binataceae bacterium]|nr:hypothetical protein [Candidatus Binataceae bacterium]
MPDQPLPNIQRVTQEELRKLFNEQYLNRIVAGNIQESVIRGAERHPSPPAAGEPYCTRSQEVSYIDPDTNEEVARAHRYLRPDGTIGASGRPDPKRVRYNGILYRIVKSGGKK